MTEEFRAAALRVVRDAHRARETAAAAEVRAVAAARNLGVTWREIAEAVGMRQPNAVRKYGPLLEQRTVVTVRKTGPEG